MTFQENGNNSENAMTIEAVPRFGNPLIERANQVTLGIDGVHQRLVRVFPGNLDNGVPLNTSWVTVDSTKL
jgi:hypothetical protein